jgi:hypothetical protein
MELNIGSGSLGVYKRPPIGLKPFIFLRDEEEPERYKNILEAIIRYEDADLHVLDIWRAEAYARYLVPSSILLDGWIGDRFVDFRFKNGMQVTVFSADPNIEHVVNSLTATHRLICKQV